MTGGAVAVLAYHDVREEAVDPVTARFAVRPAALHRQLAVLQRLGYRFVGLDAVIDGLAGRCPLPARAILLTFDDGYVSLRDQVAPILRRWRAPAVAFVVTRRLGDTNAWDRELGASERRLLDGGQLKALAADGIEVAAHSRTHRDLSELSGGELEDEVLGSVGDLESAGLPRPRAFAYPYGASSPAAVDAVRRAGCAVAFTVERGVVRRGDDPYLLPRLLVHRDDSVSGLLGRLALATARRGRAGALHRGVAPARH
jgi:peptidoglycan/xylan/chitin deacetylase (PgdA/CDA1 family)